MKIFRDAACVSFLMWMALVFSGCDSDNNCDRLGGCLPECVNQADCSEHQTCLNEGTCACFAEQNGAECTNSTDCPPDELCSAECLCVPPIVNP